MAEIDDFAGFCGRLVLDNGERMVLEPFQRTMLDEFFRGVRETLILLPKKNGKTTLLAALALYHLLTTSEAECVIAAASRDQASILYDQAVGLVKRSPGLLRHFTIKRGYRAIFTTDGRIRVLASDVDTVDGVLPTLAVVDELHRHRTAGLYGIFRDGLGPRNGRMVSISTAGDSQASTLGLMREAAMKLPTVVRDGAHVVARGPDYVLHEWSLAKGANVHDLIAVKAANPASWQTLEELRKRHDAPSMEDWQWARFACGIWQAADNWWIRAEDWHAADINLPRLRPGDTITLGFDGSRRGDGTALVGCRLDDGQLGLLGLWENPVHGDPTWEVDTSAVDARLAEVMDTFRVVRGYFDPPYWQSEIEDWHNVWGDAVTGYATHSTRMPPAVERFRTDLLAGDGPHHGSNMDLTRHVLNARTKEARGGYLLTKPVDHSPERIDAAIASVLAYEARADALAAPTPRPGRLITFS